MICLHNELSRLVTFIHQRIERLSMDTDEKIKFIKIIPNDAAAQVGWLVGCFRVG